MNSRNPLNRNGEISHELPDDKERRWMPTSECLGGDRTSLNFLKAKQEVCAILFPLLLGVSCIENFELVERLHSGMGGGEVSEEGCDQVTHTTNNSHHPIFRTRTV